MLDDFIVRAILAGVAVSFAAGPIGCFVVWRNAAYFGDATAHSAILGIALSLFLNISIYVGVFFMAFAAAICVTITAHKAYGSDTILGIFSHASLALGLVTVSLVPTQTLDLESYLFGQILAVSVSDVFIIWAGGALILAYIISQWDKLLMATLSEELAYAAGINPKWYLWGINMALAILVALAIKIIGIFLISGLLIIPAAAARPFATNPSFMAILSVLIGCISVILGVGLSYLVDTPTGPSIISIGIVLFSLAWISVYLKSRLFSVYHDG